MINAVAQVYLDRTLKHKQFISVQDRQ